MRDEETAGKPSTQEYGHDNYAEGSAKTTFWTHCHIQDEKTSRRVHELAMRLRFLASKERSGTGKVYFAALSERSKR